MKSNYSIQQRCQIERTRMAQGILLACAVMSAAFVTPVFAQQAAAQAGTQVAAVNQIEEIVVTARKRDEKFLEVPISIQAYTEKELRSAGVTDLQTLKDSSGFTFQQAAGSVGAGRSGGSIIFRGLQATYGQPRENSGSLFLDGIYVSGGQASISTVGVQRVEVLKGPQNTYFGRSTFGGAVNFITKNPADNFQGEVNASITGRGSSDVDATVEGPIVDNLIKGRLTVNTHNKVAQYHANDGGDLGAEKSAGVTGTLYITPTDKLWVRVRGHYQQDNDSAAPIGVVAGSIYGSKCAVVTGTNNAGNVVTSTIAQSWFCGTIPSMDQVGSGVITANTVIPAAAYDRFVNNTQGDPIYGKTPRLDHEGLRRNVGQYSIQGGYDLPYNATLVVNAGYNISQSRNLWDLDRSDNNYYNSSSAIFNEDYTFDTRLSSDPAKPLRGLVGASYFTSIYNFVEYDQQLPFGIVTPSKNTAFADESSYVPAVYAAVDYDILSNLTASLEARYQQDKVVDRTLSGRRVESSFKNTLPRAILKYKPTEDINLYASYAEGVQPIAVNTSYINANAAQQAYLDQIGVANFSKQPKLESYEIGIKQKLLDNRIQYSLSAYTMQWHNNVTLASVFNPTSCGITNLTPACPLGATGATVTLANEAEVKGVEFSTNAVIQPNWTVGGTIDYKQPKWKSYYNSTLATLSGGATHFDGNKLSRVPFWSGSLTSTYSNVMANGWKWYVRGDAIYTGWSYVDDINLAKTEAYTRVNSRLGFEKGNVTLELFVNNLFDDNHWDFAYRSGDPSTAPTNFATQAAIVQAPNKREVGLRARFAFE